MTDSRPILLLTTEPLPLNGSATTGAGLRAWGLCMGLRAAGIETVIGTPNYGTETANTAGLDYVRFFQRGHLEPLLASVNPTAVVLQHWGLAEELPPLSVPLAIDLAGPHLLERRFWGNPDPDKDLTEKLAALRRADFVTVSGYYQRHYFYPYLSMAGFDLREANIPVIPFSVPPPAPPVPNEDRVPYTFVYGGAFLAWQNPDAPIRWLLDEMDRHGKGRLLFFGGSHPVIDASGGRFTELAKLLDEHPRVERSGFVGFDELQNAYRHASVALDLMQFNPERELAYTTRTMIYLHCGLTVIHNNYSEIGQLIAANRCGFALDPADEVAFRKTISDILTDAAPLDEMGANALRVAEEHNFNLTVKPLAQWCVNPTTRPGKTTAALQWEAQKHELNALRDTNRRITSELDTLKGKMLVRLMCKAPSLGIVFAPFARMFAVTCARILNRKFSAATEAGRKEQ